MSNGDVVFILPDEFAQLLHHFQKIFFGAVRAQGDEFIPAGAIDEVGIQIVVDEIVAMADHLVASQMADRVIDPFQTRDIEVDDTHRLHGQLFIIFGQGVAVEGACELIAIAQIVQTADQIAPPQQRSDRIPDDAQQRRDQIEHLLIGLIDCQKTDDLFAAENGARSKGRNVQRL